MTARVSGASRRYLPAVRHASVAGAWTSITPAILERSGSFPRHAGVGVLPSMQIARRRFDRYGAGEELPLVGADAELYELNFKPFGVSVEQFRQFMGYGTRCRASKGEVLTEGGFKNDKVILVLRGHAIANEPKMPKDSVSSYSSLLTEDEAKPVYRYVGQLNDSVDSRSTPESLAPLAGSTIGAAASFFPSVAQKPYPYTISASSSSIEWVEWIRTDLNYILKQKGNESLQASWYHLLYVQVIRRHKDSTVFQNLDHGSAEAVVEVPRPSPRQLIQLSAFIGIPFFGFGFADNFIMILCGDAIDSHFGVVLGLSTMAAAGLGNWVSDVVGLGLGDFIERWCEKLGISNGRLTPAQEKLNIAKWTKLFSRSVGISLGCLAGMCPLFFLTPNKVEFREEDIDVYDVVFRPNGVSTSQFSDLMDMSRRVNVPAGSYVVTEGSPWPKTLLLLRGELATKRSGVSHITSVYSGRLENAHSFSADRRGAITKGSIVGGSKFADPSKVNEAHECNIIAEKDSEYLEWDFKELRIFMDDQKAVEASILGMLYEELLLEMKMDATKQELHHYRQLLSAVLTDGVVDDKERIFMTDMRQTLNVSEPEHGALLAELGWDREGWEKGTMLRRRHDQSSEKSDVSRSVSSRPLHDSLKQLEQASMMIEDAMLNVKDVISRPE